MYTFITDSGFDLPRNLKLPYDIKILPLRVFVNEKEYEDKVSISSQELYNLELQGYIPTTSLPKPEIIEKTIRESAEESEEVFIITISSKLSNTYDLVKNIATSMNLKNVHVLDSKTACIKQGYVILRAMEQVKNTGKLTQTDMDRFERESLLAFFVPTLEYLYKGGRIGKAKALIGRVLNLKPILTTDSDGEVSALGTVRSMDSAILTIQNIVNKFIESQKIIDDYTVIGAYTIDNMKTYFEKLIGPYRKGLIGVTNIGSAIAAHVGPEAFGIVIGKGVHLE
ncbi:DegV family protein [Fervidobacterium sp. 2310opik-2]|uniref:DegV family protein n=1 Tax=Fervidobacterium sp. 2310opik-2 TaxID=1755815 RepID=UPI0013DF4577|nr:DegV family protein [Fervidobacterium sp. 2310opik-2]KAF2962565.1 fatty acid-binding protein DegV [Fervidobacterium sp. 2310opik-2]